MNTKPAELFLKGNAPAILLSVGIAGIFLLIPVTAKIQKKRVHDDILSNWRKEEPDTKIGKAVSCAKDFAFPLAIASASTAAIILSHKITSKQLAAATAALAASGKLLKENQDAVKKIFGEDGFKEVIKEVSGKENKEIVCANKVVVSNEGLFTESSFDTYDGTEVLFELVYEGLKDGSRFQFLSSKYAVMSAFYFTNRNFMMHSAVSLLEFYEFLGIDNAPFIDKYQASMIGWDPSWMAEEYDAYFIDFDLVESEREDGQKYYIINFAYPPKLLEGI